MIDIDDFQLADPRHRAVVGDALLDRGWPHVELVAPRLESWTADSIEADDHTAQALRNLWPALDDAQRHELACRYAERVAHLDGTILRTIAAKRAWLAGDLDDEGRRHAEVRARDATDPRPRRPPHWNRPAAMAALKAIRPEASLAVRGAAAQAVLAVGEHAGRTFRDDRGLLRGLLQGGREARKRQTVTEARTTERLAQLRLTLRAMLEEWRPS